MLGRFFKRAYTVSQVLDDYQADMRLRGNRAPCVAEIACLRKHLGDLDATEIAISDLRRYQAERRDGGLAAATVNKRLAILSAAFNCAAANERIRAVPRFPKKLRAAAPRQGFFETADYDAIRSALPPWGRPILDFAWYSGWRRSEVLSLAREEVHLEARQIRLHPDRSKNRETRVLPLMGFGLEAVQAGLASPGRTVFHLADGEPVSRTYWHKTWRKAATRADRGHLLFHDLRRSVVRRMELAGVPRKTAMAWVGHKTEAVYNRYAITTEKDLLPAAEKMLRAMRPAASELRVVPFQKGLDK